MTGQGPEGAAPGDSRDTWLGRLLAAERAAYLAGLSEGFAEGYERAERDMARRWLEITRPVVRGGPDHAELERRRWGPGGREHFGDARPGDRQPVEILERARASWLPSGLGPAGMVRLGGQPVHRHACTRACSAYEPGWHTPAEAAAVLETLPGDHAQTIASLRASQQPAEAA